MSTLVFQGGEEVLYFKQLSATNEPMTSKIERKSVAKKDFHIFLLCSVYQDYWSEVHHRVAATLSRPLL